MIKKIAILTFNDFYPGIDILIKAITKTALFYNIEPYIIKDGFNGLINGWYEKLKLSDYNISLTKVNNVSNLLEQTKYKKSLIKRQVIQKMKNEKIDALIIIGGYNCFSKCIKKLGKMRAKCFNLIDIAHKNFLIPNFQIGFDTYLNKIVGAIDAIRNTNESHDQITIIEIMNNQYQNLILYAGIAGGVEIISTKKNRLSKSQICKNVRKLVKNSNLSAIILVENKLYDCKILAQKIKKIVNKNVRILKLNNDSLNNKYWAMTRCAAFMIGINTIENLINAIA